MVVLNNFKQLLIEKFTNIDTIMETNADKKLNKAEKEYPGAAVNKADKEKVSKKLVEERTCTLNNNPRNEGKLV